MPAELNMLKVGLVALGGAAGSVLRYVLQGLLNTTFPWGTMIVNVSGCFVIGLIFGMTERSEISPNVRVFAMVGVLGGYTTFSSFALESRHLLADGEWFWAAVNVLTGNAAGIAMVFAGIVVARLLAGAFK